MLEHVVLEHVGLEHVGLEHVGLEIVGLEHVGLARACRVLRARAPHNAPRPRVCIGEHALRRVPMPCRGVMGRGRDRAKRLGLSSG